MDAEFKVQLYVYDLSNGLAAMLSPSLLGKKIGGIWHTSIVVNGTEFYFGGGISTAPAGSTAFGTPIQEIDLGVTHLPMDVIYGLVDDLRHRFSATNYNLLSNNCNNFTDELSKLLLGHGIPDYIVKLPDEVMSTPFGQIIQPILSGLENQLGNINESYSAPLLRPQESSPQQTQSTLASDTLQAEFRTTMRREFASLMAQGGLTPNQAAVMALERVRAMYEKPSDSDNRSKA